MCDYSLMHLKSRSANVDDKLVVSRFTNTSSKGFASINPQETDVAICVLPGTEIAFDDNIQKQAFVDAEPIDLGFKTAIFRQINKEQSHMHHDALELPDGDRVLLSTLKVGQRASILQLPAAPQSETEAKEQERVEVVA